jgi:hypothetical protein
LQRILAGSGGMGAAMTPKVGAKPAR